MKTVQLSKKHKVFLGLATTMLSSAAIVTPLVSCSNKNVGFGQQLDREFNVTEATYKNVKKQLDAQIDKVIVEQAEEEFEERQKDHKEECSLDTLIKSKKEEYNVSMNEFDNELHPKDGSEAKSYTEIVSAISEVASNKYNIKLNSSASTASWSDLDQDFMGAYNEAKTYMDNEQIPETDKKQKLDEARKQYSELNETLIKKYGSGNALQGIVQGRSEIVALFDGVEQDTTIMAAETKLKNFMDNYDIQVRDISNTEQANTNDEPNYRTYDQIEQE